MKKLLFTLFACLLVCSLFAKEVTIAPTNNNVIKWDSFNLDLDYMSNVKSVNYPVAFNLRDDLGFDSAAKDQKETNASWALSAADAMEYSYAAKTGFDTLELSALNMINKNYYGTTVETGGNLVSITAYLQGLMGPVAEKDDPFVAPYISPAVQPDRIGSCENFYIISKGSGVTSVERNDIKDVVYSKHTGVQIGMYFDETNMCGNYSYYCGDTSAEVNNYVTIVGWDDSYPRNMFNNRPNYSGAFLCKTTFGSDFGENGYIWISYEDKSFGQAVAYDYKDVNDLPYDDMFSYNRGSAFIDSIEGYRFAQVKYWPSAGGEISGFRIYIPVNQIINCEFFINGESVGYSLDVKPDYAGYTTVYLSEVLKNNINYEAGDEIKVVVDYDPSNWGNVAIPFETAYNDFIPLYVPGSNFVGDVSGRYIDVSSKGNFGVSILTGTSVSVKSIKVSPASLSLVPGEVYPVKATVLPEEATDKSLKWSSTDESVVTVDQFGNVKGVADGDAAVVVTSVSNPSVYKEIPVTVKYRYIPVTKVKISPSTPSVVVGKTAVLSAAVSPSNATNKKVVWSTSDKKTVSVDQSGNIKGLKIGSAVITATSEDNPDISASVKVDVTSVKVTKIVIPKTITLKEGESYTFAPEVLPATATDKSVSYSISNSKVATISKKGVLKAKSFTSTAKTVSAVVTVKSKDNPDVKATCTVKVVHTVSYIKVSPSAVTLNVGETATIKATVYPTTAYDKSVVWSTSNKAVATVTQKGVIKAVKGGKCKITVKSAENPNVKKVITVTVNIPVTKIKIAAVKTVKKGAKFSISYSVLPSNATNKEVVWKSSNTKVVKVDKNTGACKAVGFGKAVVSVISAENSKIKGNCTVTVK